MPESRKWLRTTATCPVFIFNPLVHFPSVPLVEARSHLAPGPFEDLATATAVDQLPPVRGPSRSEYDLQRELLLPRGSRTNQT